MTRIAVAMSGGVDSSVAAALLLESGVEVVGITLKLWDDSRCCSLTDADDARAVARILSIPHYVVDAREVFEREVISPFVEEWRRGRTPSPCVQCNRRLKFGWLLERARVLGCEGLATGHYARIERDESGRARLLRGADRAKDQSYFVVPESREVLERLLFPLGGYPKEEIRRMAADRGLPVASKPDSQDLCFLPEGGLAEFLDERLGADLPGAVVDVNGRKLGVHRGMRNYTLGQRKGLGIASSEPLFVVEKRAVTGEVVLGPRAMAVNERFSVAEAAWLADLPGNRFSCAVRTRSTGQITGCEVETSGGAAAVKLEKPQFAVTPGQFAVFYAGDEVLGGGWISTVEPAAADK